MNYAIDSITRVRSITKEKQTFSNKLTFIGRLIYRLSGEKGLKKIMELEKRLSYKK